MVQYIPIIKINQPSIVSVWQEIHPSMIIIRLQDLVSPVTYQFNKVFSKIKESNSIKEFLKYHGKVILSFIMKDDIIKNFPINRYVEAINTLKPDFFTTVDGWTYEGEYEISEQEIIRCFLETKQIINQCPDATPIGQIKGCSKEQMKYHIGLLKSLGINRFVFHVGDYFRDTDEKLIGKAKVYSSFIKKKVESLILYGMGSQKKITEYSFADAYASMNYFIKARRGIRIKRTNETSGHKYCYELVCNNLVNINENILRINSQTKLIGGDALSEEEQVMEDLLSQEAVQVTIAH
ncbi:hypothetical protein K9M79_01480 [Candidatus Woesearchaeota archaeon]|nr:hypothetical protein [Candidatus Woesearchaeota archaeon]